MGETEWVVPEEYLHRVVEQDNQIADLEKELQEARQECEVMQRWVNDLHSGMYINCVYCGHRYGPSDEVPASMADVLKEHIEQCPKHPLSEARKIITVKSEENETLKALRDELFETLKAAEEKIAILSKPATGIVKRVLNEIAVHRETEDADKPDPFADDIENVCLRLVATEERVKELEKELSHYTVCKTCGLPLLKTDEGCSCCEARRDLEKEDDNGK